MPELRQAQSLARVSDQNPILPKWMCESRKSGAQTRFRVFNTRQLPSPSYRTTSIGRETSGASTLKLFGYSEHRSPLLTSPLPPQFPLPMIHCPWTPSSSPQLLSPAAAAATAVIPSPKSEAETKSVMVCRMLYFAPGRVAPEQRAANWVFPEEETAKRQ